ncbi:hypothetical protein ACFQ2B_14170 [Streptomyces stramineus]
MSTAAASAAAGAYALGCTVRGSFRPIFARLSPDRLGDRFVCFVWPPENVLPPGSGGLDSMSTAQAAASAGSLP